MIGCRSKEGVLTQEQLQEFLDKGDTITKCPPRERTENLEFKHSFYGSKKKKADEC